MTNKIAFVVDGKSLTALTRESFANEDLFQSLLADHPDVLAPAAGATGRLLLVKREQPVPDELEGEARWLAPSATEQKCQIPPLRGVKRIRGCSTRCSWRRERFD